jgi:hypothetical protein
MTAHARAALAATALAAALAGCSSSAPPNITLSTAQQAASGQPAADVQTDTIKWTRTKPGCKGTCPRIQVDSVGFPGIPRLTGLVDHVLAYMTGTDMKHPGPYETLDEYAKWFFETAQPRDETVFTAKVVDTVGDVIAIELDTQQMITGAAHPIPATQYLNWLRASGKVLSLDDVTIPGRVPQFMDALKAAHTAWLKQNQDAQRDPAAYNRTWPFQENDNFALTREGVVVKYQAYSIAPYYFGEPELKIPYSALQGILKPEFIPPPAH